MRRAYVLRRSRAAEVARLCGGLAVPVLLLAAIGSRAGLVPAAALLPALVLGFVLALLALGIAVYALADIWKNGASGGRAAIAGILYASPAIALLGVIAAAAVHYPRLTDVTTSYDDPPEFLSYGAPQQPPRRDEIRRQREGYPDLVTRTYPLPLGEVYAAARDVFGANHWTVTRDSRPTVMPEASPNAGTTGEGDTEEVLSALALKSVMTQSRGVQPSQESGAGVAGEEQAEIPGNVAILEATAPTPVFGFHDDVVVRMRGSAEGTDVDMRSASRTGDHDLGQNARRIKAFYAELDKALQLESSAASSSGVAALRR